MNEDEKQDALAAETTYFPPPQPGAGTASDDRPPDTLARAADSTLHRAPAVSPDTPLHDLQVATIDLPPSAPPQAGSTTSPTLDWSAAQGASHPLRAAVSTTAARQIGEYDVGAELGRGGMGVVYQARHRQLGRVVALKMIRSGAHADAEELDRFLVEARAVARLQHPGIVQIFDIGQHDGLPYFSLEFVAGRTLLARVAKEPLEPREAAELIEQLAHAMQYAHDQGILHRDLKPANVLLTPDGKPKITDFGLAKHIEGESASTQTGSIVGTPSYMSPEQASGNSKQLTPATDQYALGAVLYHLLTGRPPFLAAKAVETLLQVLHDEPVALRQLLPKLPIDLETICLKALQKDPQRRYASCDELAADLRRFLNGEPILARPVSRPQRVWRWCRRNPRIAIPTAASILLFLIAFGISVGSAWALASLNADLQEQTNEAIKQTGIAQANEKKAKTEEEEARKQEKKANDHAGVALNTIKRVFIEMQSGVGRTPALQPLKKKLVETATKDLSSLKDSIGTSGITGAATTLKYHELMAQLHRDVGETEQAWSHLVKAHEIANQRIKDQEGSTAARLNLATICEDLASIRQVYNRSMEDSLVYSQQAARILEDVLANPNPALNDELRLGILLERLDPAYSSIATTFIRLGDTNQALAFFEKAQQVRESILRDPAYLALPQETREKNEAGFRERSAKSYWALGDLYYRSRQPEKGEESFGKALEIYQELFDKNPANPFARQNLLGASSQAGYWLFVFGAPDRARPLYDRALDLASKLDGDFPGNVPIRTTLALMQYRIGVLMHAQGDAKATEHFDACLKIRTELATKDQVNVKRQQELMLALARSGKHGEASRKADEILKAVKESDIELLLDVARAYAQCGVAVLGDEAAAEAFRVKAIEAITHAVKAGHQDKVYLATEPDFVPLRQRDDFRALAAANEEPQPGP
ncbi:MAG TPA: serine/threonine-protein kinase [Pirellulaceae bacterium]|nr:serine/threonine-protein kinase [Pirellulaceae bacterium]